MSSSYFNVPGPVASAGTFPASERFAPGTSTPQTRRLLSRRCPRGFHQIYRSHTSSAGRERHIPKLDYLAASAALGDTPLPWNSCKLAASLVLILAAPKDPEAMHSALKFQSSTLGGLPTMAMINSTPSADLAARFARAKKAALDGKVGKVTVLTVSLWMWRRLNKARVERSLWITHLLRILLFSVLLAKDGAFFRRGGSTNIRLINISTVVGHG